MLFSRESCRVFVTQALIRESTALQSKILKPAPAERRQRASSSGLNLSDGPARSVLPAGLSVQQGALQTAPEELKELQYPLKAPSSNEGCNSLTVSTFLEGQRNERDVDFCC